MGVDGWEICFAMIEFVTEGKLEKFRVINTYRNIALDIEIKIEAADVVNESILTFATFRR